MMASMMFEPIPDAPLGVLLHNGARLVVHREVLRDADFLTVSLVDGMFLSANPLGRLWQLDRLVVRRVILAVADRV